MKKAFIVLVLSSALLVPQVSFAAFNTNLSYGSSGEAVTQLQQFLTSQKLYSAGITGNFYLLTQAAVKAFQIKNEITPASGYFGPLTRTKANTLLSQTSSTSSVSTGAIPAIASVAPATSNNQHFTTPNGAVIDAQGNVITPAPVSTVPPVVISPSIVNQAPAPVAATQTPEQDPNAESYKYSDTYPIILSFQDNKGTVYKSSMYNGYSGPYSSYTKQVLHVGDTIQATVTAKDPQGRPLLYNWNASSQAFNTAVQDGNYTSNNSINYTLTTADLQSAGDTFRLVYQIRGDSGFYRAGANQEDDQGFVDYTLEP